MFSTSLKNRGGQENLGFYEFVKESIVFDRAEALAVSSNIFVGVESAFTVKPHIYLVYPLTYMLGVNPADVEKIATYALCGFTYIASIAIFVGAISGIAPEKTKEITQVAFRSLIAATLACLMTGGIAGIFYRGSTLLIQ